MKINFKKVASVLATTFMLGGTIAFASAAYPAPFVNNGVGDAAIVYGAAAPATGGDMAQATDLGASLEKSVTSTTVSNTAPTGEAKAVETGSQKLYLGDYMNSTKQTFTKTEMPTVLADGTVIDTDGTSYSVSQKIEVPNAQVLYDKTADNLDTPVLNVKFPSSTTMYSSDIVFTPAVNVTKLADKDITLFGQKYTFSGNANDLTSTQVVLYKNANTKVINSGETVSVNVGGTAYTITVNSVEDQSNALISVNGVSQKVVEGSSYKVSGLDIYAKNVIGPNVAGESRGVELSLGASKLTLQAGNPVESGSNTIDGTNIVFTNSGTKVSNIKVQVEPSSLTTSIDYLKMGDSLTDPVFGAFKMSFSTYTPAMDDASKDQIVVKTTGDAKAAMTWTNKNGETYNQDMFMPSSTCLNSTLASGTCGTSFPYNGTALGYDIYTVATSATSAPTNKQDYFITTSGQYSQIWRVQSITLTSSKNQVTVRDIGTGGADQTVDFSSANVGATASISLADGNTATLTLNNNDTAVDTNRAVNVSASPIIYTKSGALINLTDVTTTGLIQVAEETQYNDGTWYSNTGAQLGEIMRIGLLYDSARSSGNKMKVNSFTSTTATAQSVGDNDKYYLTKYGTFVKYTGSDDKVVTMYYPGTAASLGVYFAEQGASTSGATGAIPVVADTNVQSVKDKNLIVVGGSCINTVAASLLGSSSPLCGSAFTAASGVGVNQYMIKVFPASTLFAGSSKVAMLVAGYEAAETAAAVAKVKEGTTDMTVGTSVIGPTTV